MSELVGHFRECITHFDIGGMLESPPVKVHMAYGPEDSTDWAGGFVVEMKNGRYALSRGWCDYTGWG